MLSFIILDIYMSVLQSMRCLAAHLAVITEIGLFHFRHFLSGGVGFGSDRKTGFQIVQILVGSTSIG